MKRMRSGAPGAPPTSAPGAAARMLILLIAACASAANGQSTYSEDFQSLSAFGWSDPAGVFRTWPDPLRSGNIVYGVRETRRRAVVPGAGGAFAGASAAYTAQLFAAPLQFR